MWDLAVDQHSTWTDQHSTTHVEAPRWSSRHYQGCNFRWPKSFLHSKWSFSVLAKCQLTEIYGHIALSKKYWINLETLMISMSTIIKLTVMCYGFLKPNLKKLCKKDPANWDKYLNQVLTSYRITPNLATTETPFFLVYGRDPNLPLYQLLEPMQCFLGDPDSGMLNLETHRLALAIVKKMLDENRFKTAQKTMAWEKPAFQVGDHVFFKNKQSDKWDLKWRPRYRMVCIEHNRHFLHIEN